MRLRRSVHSSSPPKKKKKRVESVQFEFKITATRQCEMPPPAHYRLNVFWLITVYSSCASQATEEAGANLRERREQQWGSGKVSCLAFTGNVSYCAYS